MTVKSFYLSSLPLLAISSSLQAAPSKKVDDKPNIIYILADDLGYGEIGCYGQKLIETPNIDRLAADGMVLTDFYSGSPVSAPARCSLLTGKHSGHGDIRGNDEMAERGMVRDFLCMERDSTLEGQRGFLPGTVTFPMLLQQKGYETGCVGKWGLGAPGTNSLPDRYGFDFFYGYNCQRQAHTYYPLHLYRNENREYLHNDTVIPHRNLDPGADSYNEASYRKFVSNVYSPDIMHKEALEFIQTNKDLPFFLYYATPLPHVPIQAPQRLVDHYLKKFGTEKPYTGESGYFPVRYPHATYAAMVTYIDEKVGEIVDALKKDGVYDNTLIIFTSDNGPTFNGGTDSPWFDSGGPFKSEYGWGKCFLREGGIRVPFIATWRNGIKAGGKSDLPSVSYDIFATVCDIAGIENNTDTDGISLMSTLTGRGKQQQHDYLYWEFMDLGGQQAVRVGDWKGIRNNVKSGNKAIELYDLKTDIKEQNNIAAAHPDIVKRISDIMDREHITASYPSFRVPQLDNVN